MTEDGLKSIMKKRITLISVLILSLLLILSVGLTVSASDARSDGLVVDENLVIVSKNLSYQDSTHLVFAADTLDYDRENVELVFWKDEPSSQLDTPYHVDRTYEEYKSQSGKISFPAVYTSSGISPKNGTEYIYYALHVKNTNVYGPIARYSVIQYLYEKQTSDKVNETQQRAFNSLLEYIESIQLLLKYNTDSLPSDLRYVKVEGGRLSDGYESGVYKIGDEITVITDSESDFSSWINSDGAVISKSPSFTFILTDSHTNLVSTSSCKLTVNGGSCDSEEGIYTPGAIATLSAAPIKTVDNSLYYFDCWRDSQGQILSPLATASITVTKSDTITAEYRLAAEGEYTVNGYDQTGQKAPALSSSPSKSASASNSEIFASRVKTCKNHNGYYLDFCADKTTSSAPVYLNHQFSLSDEQIFLASLDFCLGKSDRDYSDFLGGSDGVFNQLNDFFTDSQPANLFEIGLYTGDNSLARLALLPTVSANVVTGYNIILIDGDESVSLTDTPLEIESLHSLAFEFCRNGESGTARSVSIYVDGVSVFSSDSVSIEIAGTDLTLSVGVMKTAKGNIHLDNFTFISHD